MSHTQKCAVITGGTSGIGFAIAKKLSENGNTVLLIGRDVLKGQNAQKQIQNSIFFSCDVTNEKEVEKLFWEINKTHSTIDILVNAAGKDISHPDITKLSEEIYESLLDANLKSTVLMTKYAIPFLLQSKGTIVNIASQLGINVDTEVPIYSAAKAAVISFTKSMAKTYGKDGIRINAVCPGGVNTPLLRQFFADENELENWYNDPDHVPLRRVGEPKDIASAVSFLISDDASYITGATLLVDGGSSLM